jgi:hypothetical protein
MPLRGFRAGDAANSRHRTPFGKGRKDAVLCGKRQVKIRGALPLWSVERR